MHLLLSRKSKCNRPASICLQVLNSAMWAVYDSDRNASPACACLPASCAFFHSDATTVTRIL